MQNLYETVKGSLFFNKFIVNELVCVEYTCPLDDEHLGVFTQHDYIIHVLSGKKSWKTIHGKWTIKAGETLFVKKGAAMITQFFDDDFCMLGFFLPDDLIRDSLEDVIHKISTQKDYRAHQFTATALNNDDYLEAFFQSMLIYFRSPEQPPDSIIKLKLKELLINLVYNCNNQALVSYLKMLTENISPSVPHIMEANFCYNLKLEEFAKMSCRSLSTFKRDFYNHYNMTPGKWLLSKRLDFAKKLLVTQQSSITQIAFESGFKDSSHFSRAFKQKFGTTPSAYRKTSSPRHK